VADRPGPVALLGAGVIGGGWAARFLLSGWDVRLHDPDPEAGRKVAAIVSNARRSWRSLTLAPLPAEGSLTIAGSLEEAVAGACFVQESAPEREPLKQELLARADAAAPADAVFASSTSGLRPSRLQAEMARPERLVVGHPFNPVYLLPLVEVCGGERSAPESCERAAAVYRSIGMAPLLLRHEIDGFIADRLMEAMWREALWMVADDVATASEIDDAIRLGPGLRWSFMGVFLTYRIAGGEAGMRHFLAQFGPALQWPWTRLTDVPELTEELIGRIVAQSEDQAAGRSPEELERERDDRLVAVLQALRGSEAGAGAAIRDWERRLLADAAPNGRPTAVGELLEHRATVLPEWVDYNGHAHESRYLQVFGDATDALLARLGIDEQYLGGGGSYYTVESHLTHRREARAGDRLLVTTQVLGVDERRLHVFHSLRRDPDGELLATAEQMLLHVDTRAGRAAPAGDGPLAAARELADLHAALDPPEAAGRAIRLPD
jgi:carnitine 3-dehydrogenase / betainyl-CoA thioesterase